MSDSIKALASSMVLRKKAGADPYILFLGAGASINSGCSSMMSIVNDALKQHAKTDFDKWENKIEKAIRINEEYGELLKKQINKEKRARFFEIWRTLDDNTRYSILRKHLWEGKSPSEGYDNLAQLIKKGFIETVFSTNLDNLLERALNKAGMCYSDDFVVVVNGKDRPEVIAQQLNSSYTPLKIIKLHGSLEFPKSYAFTPEEISNFESQIKSEISRFINQSLIIAGYSMQDRDVYVLFEEEGNEIHFVNSTTPEPESEISRILSVRGKGKIIDGDWGNFDAFFRKLLMDTEDEEEINGLIPSNESRNVSKLKVPNTGNTVAYTPSGESDIPKTSTGSSTSAEYNIKELYDSLDKKYSIVSDYLPRKVCKARDFSPSIALFSSKDDHKNVYQEITKNKHIVLLCDAGVGKTTELKQLACHYSGLHPYFPIFVPLNKYTNKSIKEYFPKYWELIPEKELVILLDGFDEIESKNINDAIREIEFFCEKHPNAHVVVSCRTNFYKIETEGDEGKLNGFISYILLELENEEIKKYVKDKLDFKSNDFFDSIYEKDLYLLLRSPFYLKCLVELFTKNNDLPKSKAEIFKNLLESRIKLDIKHYRTTKELEQEKKNVMKNLEYIALAMECLGRNYIANEELEEILPEPSSRELLKYCTTWIKQETDRVTWQFEHNNFQEYLAAKKLSKYPLEVIKELVSFGHEHDKIAPSWINTLSFLVSIYDTADLQNWIFSVQPELFVKFEHDKISKEERLRIFKEIFESYEARGIWINRGKFRPDELARFGQSDEIIDYLLNKVENDAHYTTIGTSIELLCELEIPPEKEDRAKELLIKRALETSYEGTVQNLALECLSFHKFDSKEIIDQIVPSLKKSKDGNIRSGLYRLLCNSDCFSDYIDIFLEGIDCAYSRKIFSSSELTYLNEGFNKANSPESIRKIIEFFRKEPENLDKLYFDREIGFLENATQAYKEDPSILESCLELFKVLLIGHERQVQRVLSFFDNTNSRLQVFQKIYLGRNVEKFSFLILGTLADTDCIEFFIKEYEEGRITDAEVWQLQNSLAFQNKELQPQFNEVIVEKFGEKFALSPKTDYEKMRIQGTQRDVELLFSKELFLEEILRIFKISKKDELTCAELFLLETEYFEDNLSKLIIYLLCKIAGDKAVSSEKAIERIDSLKWDYFVIGKVYDMSRRDEGINFTQDQKQYVSEWCLSNVQDVDFRKAISKIDNSISTNRKAIFLSYFLRKFDLSYPENVLLDMISFDCFDSGVNFVGIEYLEKRLPYPKMKKRVLENLDNGIECDFILKNHIIFCKIHRIKQILQFTPDIIIDANRVYDTRKLALDTTSEMSETLSELEVILAEIKDDFKWVVLETLIGKKKNCEAFLLNAYNKGNEDDKLKASAYLMRLQNIKGLGFFIEWIEENEEYPWFINESPLRFLHDNIFVPNLLKLLKISYQDNISQDNFHSLHNDVLEALSRIAMNSEQNFYEIKKCIEDFITENSSNIANINFLYSYLEGLELKFSDARNKDINFVIAKFQELSIK